MARITSMEDDSGATTPQSSRAASETPATSVVSKSGGRTRKARGRAVVQDTTEDEIDELDGEMPVPVKKPKLSSSGRSTPRRGKAVASYVPKLDLGSDFSDEEVKQGTSDDEGSVVSSTHMVESSDDEASVSTRTKSRAVAESEEDSDVAPPPKFKGKGKARAAPKPASSSAMGKGKARAPPSDSESELTPTGEGEDFEGDAQTIAARMLDSDDDGMSAALALIYENSGKDASDKARATAERVAQEIRASTSKHLTKDKKVEKTMRKAVGKPKSKGKAKKGDAFSGKGHRLSDGESVSEDSEEDELSDLTPSESEEDVKGKGKGKAKEGKAERRARLAKEREEKRARRGRPQWLKTQMALEGHHPELKNLWENTERDHPVNRPPPADQPDGLFLKLLPFQQEGLAWMKQQEAGPWKGGCQADEMGMGKTIQSISLILSDHEKGVKRRTLVIAPTVAIMQWRNEFNKHTKCFKVLVWHGGNRSNEVEDLKDYDVILTSYAVLESAFRRQHTGFKRKGELLKEDSPLHKIKWHRIILDEAHNIKDRACNTAKGAFALKGKFRWCLSGTPLMNRVGELYSMIRFLQLDPMAHYYCKKCKCKSMNWMFSNKKTCDDCGHSPMQHTCLWNQEILKPIQKYGHEGQGQVAFGKLRILMERLMLRRTKLERADDLGLPPRTVVVRRDHFTEEEEELYMSLFKDVKRKFSTYVEDNTVLNNYSSIFTLITRMRQMALHPDMVLKSRTAGGINEALAQAAQVDPIHTCRICLDEAEDPIVSKCRHVYCRTCVRQYVEVAATSDCVVCHLPLSIDLDQPAIDAPEASAAAKTRQGMLERIDPSKWRTSSKIEALVEELSSLRSEDSTIKSLVFSQFTSFLDLIARRLQLAGFKYVRLQGSMTPEARDRTIKYFTETTDCTVFLLSLKAGGVALNLVEASRVYVMDPWWNPAVELQAMDRVHRIGQRRPVIITRLIIANSIESQIIELQRKKESMIGAALGDEADAMARLTPEDLTFLFSS